MNTVLGSLIMDYEVAIAFSPAVIALSALGISVYQSIETRKHNRLSVIPILDDETRFRVAFSFRQRAETPVAAVSFWEHEIYRVFITGFSNKEKGR